MKVVFHLDVGWPNQDKKILQVGFFLPRKFVYTVYTRNIAKGESETH